MTKVTLGPHNYCRMVNTSMAHTAVTNIGGNTFKQFTWHKAGLAGAIQ